MKSGLPKRPSAFAPEVRGLGTIGVTPRASQATYNFDAGEVAAIGKDGQLARSGYLLRLPCHVGQLGSVVAEVGDLVCDD